MKDLIKKAVDELSAQGGKIEKTIKFSHHASSQNKWVKGEVNLSQQGTMSLNLTEIKGYSPDYINRVARTAFKAALLPSPGVGSIIWTKRNPDGLVVGQKYTFNSGAYYYGVGANAYLDCDGRALFTAVEAEYKGIQPGSCKPGAGRDYTLFRIVQS